VRNGRVRGLKAAPRTALVSILAATVLCAAAPAPALSAESASKHVVVSAQEGNIGAQLGYQEGVGGNLPHFGLRLQITRGGESFYEQPVSSRYCDQGCVPEPIGAGPTKSSPLAVGDLEGNGQPAVVLELSTGGAHCCSVLQVFSFDPGTMTYRSVERDFGDPGALVTNLAGDGRLEIESADDRFAYEFTPYAYSGLPLQIWSFREGRFIDVTKQFPEAVAADATRQFKGFLANRRQGYGLGLIAAWAADQELLGHDGLVRTTLAREVRHGRLRSREHYAPAGRAFVVKLMRFLARSGYR
jgi:hypothetical protein